MLTERVELRCSKDFLARLDRWRREQEDLPSRGEAIRRMVETVVKPAEPLPAEAVSP